jgi:hypothetical protein
MKKLSLTISFILISISCAFAQGNLQFNQVLNFTSGAQYVVPSNKALKIESINVSYSNNLYLNYFGCDTVIENNNNYVTYCKYVYPNSSPAFLQIGSIKFYPTTDFYHGYPYYRLSSYSYFLDCSACPPTRLFPANFPNLSLSCPVWLGQGDSVVIAPYLPQFNYGESNFGIHISAIEFNIVP